MDAVTAIEVQYAVNSHYNDKEGVTTSGHVSWTMPGVYGQLSFGKSGPGGYPGGGTFTNSGKEMITAPEGSYKDRMTNLTLDNGSLTMIKIIM